MAFTKEQLLTAAKPKTTKVELAGGHIIVKELTAAEVTEFLPMKDDPAKVTPFIISRSVVDENGARLFSDTDMDAVKSLSVTVATAIVNAALEVSGLTKTETDHKKST